MVVEVEGVGILSGPCHFRYRGLCGGVAWLVSGSTSVLRIGQIEHGENCGTLTIGDQPRHVQSLT